MARWFWVNPGDTTDIVETSTPRNGYATPTGAGRPPSRDITPFNDETAAADPDIWPLGTEDDNPPRPSPHGQYYVLDPEDGFNYTFTGSAVNSSRTWVRQSVQQVYERQLSKLSDTVDRVENQGYTVTFQLAGVQNMASDSRTQRKFLNIFSSNLPGATNFTVPTLDGAFIVVNKNEADDYCTTAAITATVIDAQTQTHTDELEILRAAAEPLPTSSPEWEELAAYDVEAGYPDPPSASSTSLTMADVGRTPMRGHRRP